VKLALRMKGCISALEFVSLEDLQAHAVDAPAV
jgi:hypothetical protein